MSVSNLIEKFRAVALERVETMNVLVVAMQATGILAVFTALPLTRMWVAGWLRKTRPADINI